MLQLQYRTYFVGIGAEMIWGTVSEDSEGTGELDAMDLLGLSGHVRALF